MSDYQTDVVGADVALAASDMRESFSYDGYQIVRREMFARIREPAAVIRKDSITFNTACINGLEDTVYIEILINAGRRTIAVRRCDKDNKDAQRWCVDKPDKRRTRKITSTKFTQMVYEVMHWSDKCRYKVQGEQKELSDGTVYFFDLDQCDIIFEKKKKTKAEVLSEPPGISVPPEQQAEREAEERNMPTKPFYPDDWEHSFGVPVDQQRTFDLGALKDSDSYISIKVEEE